MADIKDFKHAIVRQKILDAVRKDLIGPSSVNEELNEIPTTESHVEQNININNNKDEVLNNNNNTIIDIPTIKSNYN